MPLSLEDLQNRIELALAARDAGDVATAIRHIDAAILIQGTIPTSAKGASSFAPDRQQLLAMRREYIREQASAVGVQRTPTVKQHPADLGDYC